MSQQDVKALPEADANPQSPLEMELDHLTRDMFEQELTYKAAESFMDKSKYTHVVALDIGGGNCSAAYSAVPSSDVKACALSVLGVHSLWSVIGYDQPSDAAEDASGKPAKPPSIGQTVKNRRYRYGNYKRVPSDHNLKIAIGPDKLVTGGRGDYRTVEELTSDYIRLLFEGILKNNESLKDCPREKILLLAGHPSGIDWKQDKPRSNLERLVREATGVPTVLTMAESNAAILYALRTWQNLGGAAGIAARTLIIDLGAYSADITFIDKVNLRHEEASIPLGGRSVDENAANIAVNRAGVKAENVHQGDLIYSVRAAKELFWPDGTTVQPVYVGLKDSGDGVQVDLTVQDFNSAVTEARFDVPALTDIIGDSSDSYTGHLARFIREAKELYHIDQVDSVVVVGGAARMTPAADAIKACAGELWGVDESHIWPQAINDELVENAVPYGMLYYFHKSMQVLCNIPGVINRLTTHALGMVPELAKQIGQELSPYLLEQVILPAARRWSGSEQDHSVNDLVNAILSSLGAGRHQQRIKEICAEKAESVGDEKKEGFQSVITDLLNDLYGTRADPASWAIPDMDPNISGNLASILKPMISGAMKSAVSKALDLGLMSVVVALVLPIGLAAVAMEKLKEKTMPMFRSEEQIEEYQRKKREEEIARNAAQARRVEEDRKKPQDRAARERGYKKLQTRKQQDEFQAKLTEGLQAELLRIWRDNAFGVPEAYIRQLHDGIRKAVYTG